MKTQLVLALIFVLAGLGLACVPEPAAAGDGGAITEKQGASCSGFVACFAWGADETWTDSNGNHFSTVGSVTYGDGVPACLEACTGIVDLHAYNTVTHVTSMERPPAWLEPSTFVSCSGGGTDETLTNGTHTYTTVGIVQYPNAGVPSCVDTAGRVFTEVQDTSVTPHVRSMQLIPDMQF